VLIQDYNKTVQEVYTETARVLFGSYRKISLLSHVKDHSRTRVNGMPSWVPDLSVPLDHYPLRFRGASLWKAAGDRYWRPNTSRMVQRLLDVQGDQLDYIEDTSVLLDESTNPSASWASIVKLVLSLNLLGPITSRTTNSHSRVEILWRTLTTDIYAHVHPAPPAVRSITKPASCSMKSTTSEL
jgi:hypothetical protein